MGTNYYARPPGTCTSPCDNWIHIGKSSNGYQFLFHGYEEGDLDSDYVSIAKITTIGHVLQLAASCEVYDEYGTLITPDELQKIVASNANGKSRTGGQYQHGGVGDNWYFGDFS